MAWHDQLPVKCAEPHRLVPNRPILIGYRGSVAHGMYVAPAESTGIDDIDLMGVYVSPLEHYFGLGRQDTKESMIGQIDCVSYELRKYVGLLQKANPNVLSLLWLKDYLLIEPEGAMLVRERKFFATKMAYHSFSGYAYAQLKRMESFKDVMDSDCGCTGKFHVNDCALAAERGRGSTKRFATGFMGAKRKGLVAKFGYDTKNAAHLIRLLKMGIELLRTGDIIVDRREAGDVDELLSIKRGEWSLARVKSLADELFAELKTARDSSTLPDRSDDTAVESLLMEMLCHAHATTVAVTDHWHLRGKPSVYDDNYKSVPSLAEARLAK